MARRRGLVWVALIGAALVSQGCRSLGTFKMCGVQEGVAPGAVCACCTARGE